MKRLRITLAAFLCLVCLAAVFSSSLTAGAYTPIKAVIPISCLKVSDSGASTYEIQIEQESPDAPMPNEKAIQVAQNGKGSFTIDITEPGTYRYRIFEKAGNDPNINYDKRTYIAAVFVENGADGKLVYSLSVSEFGKDSKLDGVDFKNEAAAEHTQTTPTPVASKTDVNPTTGNTAGKSLYAKILKITMLLLVSIAAVSLIIGRESERGEESAQD